MRLHGNGSEWFTLRVTAVDGKSEDIVKGKYVACNERSLL